MNCIALVWKYDQILGFPYHKSLFTSKFKGEAKIHEIFKTQKPFLEIPPRDDLIRLLISSLNIY